MNIDFFIRGEDREIFFHSKLGQVATCPCGLRFLWWHLWAREVQARASAELRRRAGIVVVGCMFHGLVFLGRGCNLFWFLLLLLVRNKF